MQLRFRGLVLAALVAVLACAPSLAIVEITTPNGSEMYNEGDVPTFSGNHGTAGGALDYRVKLSQRRGSSVPWVENRHVHVSNAGTWSCGWDTQGLADACNITRTYEVKAELQSQNLDYSWYLIDETSIGGQTVEWIGR